MIFYQILSALCFVGFLINIAFIIYLHNCYEIPKALERYMFLSLFKNIIGAITQLYTAPYDCVIAWYVKSFTITVCFASFFWCLDTYRISEKKVNSKTNKNCDS